MLKGLFVIPDDMLGAASTSTEWEIVDTALDGTSGIGGIFTLIFVILWIYMPGYLANSFAMLWGKIFPKYGYGPWPIDSGKNAWDGNRILGDGKTWNGLIGGSLTSGILSILLHAIAKGNNSNLPFLDVLAGSSKEAWFWIGGEWGAAFILGTALGFACLLGDLAGSFVKRRRGLKREGEVSSKAPLLDTLPFAIFLILFGMLFLGDTVIPWDINSVYAPHGSSSLISVGIPMLIIIPFMHRGINIIGYKLGWKDVPY